MGTMGEAISLRVPNLPIELGKVVKQIERSRSPDPIMRRPRADREEKRVKHGTVRKKCRRSLTSATPIREDS